MKTRISITVSLIHVRSSKQVVYSTIQSVHAHLFFLNPVAFTLNTR